MTWARVAAAVPKPATAVGSMGLTVAAVNVLLGLLNGWHWWAHEPTTFQTSAQVILDAGAGYLAAWLSVVRSKGQTQTLTLTSSPLPTLQQETVPSPPPPPAAKL